MAYQQLFVEELTFVGRLCALQSSIQQKQKHNYEVTCSIELPNDEPSVARDDANSTNAG